MRLVMMIPRAQHRSATLSITPLIQECSRRRSALYPIRVAAFLFIALGGWSAAAAAFELQRAEAQFVEREYRFEMTAVLEAPVERVERILRDYDNYTTLDSRILEARVLDRPDANTATLATTLRACFGPVCRTVKRIELVEESPLALVALTDASRSDVKFGETRMQLSSIDGHRTQVVYRTRLQPAFWIPALVARRMMLETLEDATIELFQNVEKQAADAQQE